MGRCGLFQTGVECFGEGFDDECGHGSKLVAFWNLTVKIEGDQLWWYESIQGAP